MGMDVPLTNPVLMGEGQSDKRRSQRRDAIGGTRDARAPHSNCILTAEATGPRAAPYRRHQLVLLLRPLPWSAWVYCRISNWLRADSRAMRNSS